MKWLNRKSIGRIFTPLIFLVAPLKIFEDLKLKPKWGVPFLFTVLGLMVKTFLGNSWGNQPIVAQAHALYLYGIILSAGVVLGWSAISTFLYLTIYLIQEDQRPIYRAIFSVVSYCGVIFLLGEICNSILIHANIMDSMRYPLSNQFPVGLDVLTPEHWLTPARAVLLHSINPFSIWYFTMISIGLSMVAGLSKARARLLSIILWLLALSFAESVLLITGETSVRLKF